MKSIAMINSERTSNRFAVPLSLACFFAARESFGRLQPKEPTMKLSKWILSIFILIATAALSGFAQEFTFTTTPANASGPRALIDMPGLTGNPMAVIVATPIGETEMLNQHPIGVWYIGGKWYLVNVDIGVIPPGAKYRIQFFQRPGSDHFLHLVTNKNIGAEGSYIDSPVLNNNPNAQVKILQNHAPEVRSPFALYQAEAKAAYSAAAGRWYIAGNGEKPLIAGNTFNIVVSSGTTGANDSNTNPTPGNPPGNTNPNVNPGNPAGNPNINPNPGNPNPTNPGGIPQNPGGTPQNPGGAIPQTPIPGKPIGPRIKVPQAWVLNPDPTPSIPPNSDIILFIHGMDSRAEEADDITKALFMLLASRTSGPTPAQSPSAQTAAVLNEILQKFKSCILERYETQQDMLSRGLAANLSGLTTTAGLQDRDAVICVSGNQCTLAGRRASFNALQAQANRGDTTNFESNLEMAIPKDCFECQKHQEFHTKHVHCTMEAGGNSGLLIGPKFEACKAGVDLQALANTIAGYIRNRLTDLTGNVQGGNVTGGASIATNYSTVQFKDCDSPSTGCPETCDYRDTFSAEGRKAALPMEKVDGRDVPLYYEPMIPRQLLDADSAKFNDPAAHNIGPNEGRLNAELRAAARAADPRESLRLAATKFAEGKPEWGNAYADLSVTGHNSFAKFSAAPPQDDFCQSLPSAPQVDILTGCRTALERAYRVANFLRSGQRGDTPADKTRKTNERVALGWIAVSGEDDSPHRPVNAPSSDFPQFDIDVSVPAKLGDGQVTVRTRYTIAAAPVPSTGRNLVVIALDLPTSGYSENLNFDRISPLTAIGNPKLTPLPIPIVVPVELSYFVPGMGVLPPGIVLPPGTPLPDFQFSGKTPLLQFIEDDIVNFVETLDTKVPVKNNIKAVMGGSLGGNMTFRLGRRPGVPWLPKFIVWSPASIWNSLGGGSDLLQHYGPRAAWEGANKAHTLPGDGDRAAFFGSWDKPIVPVIIPMAQSDTWTSDYYQCKKSCVAAARLDRHETYDANFLAWHWRLGGEQLLYSHQAIDPATNKPLYMANQKPMLLGCGTEDHVKFNDICPATQRTAPLMTMTPGKALFLEKTGHSLDNERRNFWAVQIVDFLGL